MNTLKRIRQIVAANINHMLEKAEDPEKMIKQLIREMDQNIVGLRLEVARVIAAEKRVSRRLEQNHEKVARLNARAEQAVQHEDEDAARDFLRQKLDLEQGLPELEIQQGRAREAAEAMKSDLQHLENKVQEARQRKDILIARKRRAAAERGVLDRTEAFGRAAGRVDSLIETSTIDGTSSVDTLDDAVADMEATVAARREVRAISNTSASLDRAERAAQVDGELAALRERLRK